MFVFDVIITCKSTKLLFEPKLLGVGLVEQNAKNNCETQMQRESSWMESFRITKKTLTHKKEK